jgi:hypothetical protein
MNHRDISSKQNCMTVENKLLDEVHSWRRRGAKARVNVGGSAFNIINMEYYRTPEGERLRYHDDLVKYRNGIRAYNLALKSSVGVDPIAGCKSFDITLPVMTTN